MYGFSSYYIFEKLVTNHFIFPSLKDSQKILTNCEKGHKDIKKQY